jgi:phosphate transport system substrate-binding protein
MHVVEGADRVSREVTWLMVAATCMSLLVTLAGAEAPQDALVFAGSGSNLPIIRRLAEAFRQSRPDITISVPASLGSTGGIRAAAEGAIALGLISRPLKEHEKGLGLTLLPFARTAVVLGAHPAVVDDALTSGDLVRIYEGTKRRWRDGREIVVLTREPGDSSIEVLEQKIPGFTRAYVESQRAKRWVTLFTDQEMYRTLVSARSGIGLLDMGAIVTERLPVKPLQLDGVAPTLENVRSGAYPLTKTQTFAFKTDGLPPGARAFIDFVRSAEGKRILTRSGYVPVD